MFAARRGTGLRAHLTWSEIRTTLARHLADVARKNGYIDGAGRGWLEQSRRAEKEEDAGGVHRGKRVLRATGWIARLFDLICYRQELQCCVLISW